MPPAMQSDTIARLASRRSSSSSTVVQHAAGRTQRVAHRDRAAVDVGNLVIDAQSFM